MAYPITDIPGLRPEAVEILKSEGIRTTIGLLRSAKTPKQRGRLAQLVGTKPASVLGWVTAADRMRVKGIGAEYAQLLGLAGVSTVSELRYRNPKHLVDQMEQASKQMRVKLLPKEKTVGRWIESAKKLPPLIRY
jgi:hypothetical protein